MGQNINFRFGRKIASMICFSGIIIGGYVAGTAQAFGK
jgi:hypothetical protein